MSTPLVSPSTAVHRLDLLWAPVTIRVAWELQRQGFVSRGETFLNAREHVLLSLPTQVDAGRAEDLATYFVGEFIDRFSTGRYRRRALERGTIEPRHRWRDRLLELLDPLGTWVFRGLYGDGLDIEQVADLTQKDPAAVVGSQEGVRAALRAILSADGVALTATELRGVDRLLQRLAWMAAPDCDGGVGLLFASRRAHVERCVRCTRGLRLVRGGLLAPADLAVPEGVLENWPAHTSVLCLHLHPDAREHRRPMSQRLRDCCIRADDDTVLIQPEASIDIPSAVWDLAEAGTPPRHHLRGALVRGPGRWVRGGLLGPVASAAVELTRSRQWGEVDEVGPLPETIPQPPPMHRWWMAATLFLLLAVLGGTLTMREPHPSPAFPLSVEFTGSEAWVGARFDTSDEAFLLVVVRTAAGLELVHQSQRPSDKGELATGVGDYQLQWPGRRILLATTERPVENLGALLAVGLDTLSPLDDFAQAFQASYPKADLVLQSRRKSSQP